MQPALRAVTKKGFDGCAPVADQGGMSAGRDGDVSAVGFVLGQEAFVVGEGNASVGAVEGFGVCIFLDSFPMCLDFRAGKFSNVTVGVLDFVEASVVIIANNLTFEPTWVESGADDGA